MWWHCSVMPAGACACTCLCMYDVISKLCPSWVCLLSLPLPSPRASDPTSPQCSTLAPSSGPKSQGWVGPHDQYMDRTSMAVGGVVEAAWVAYHVSPSNCQEHPQGMSLLSYFRSLPPCQECHPPESSTPRWLGIIFLCKVCKLKQIAYFKVNYLNTNVHNVHVLMCILCDCMDTCWVTTETDIYKNISIIKSLLSFILQLHDCLYHTVSQKCCLMHGLLYTLQPIHFA